MRALTVIPHQANSLELSDVPEPEQNEGDVLVDVVAVGICGTDVEIMGGEYGEAPPGHDRLVLGHESLGRVREAPSGRAWRGATSSPASSAPRPGALPQLRRRAVGHVSNGTYTEHGIKGLDGFMRERYGRRRTASSRSTPRSGSSACCSSPPASWRRPGRRSTGSPNATPRSRRSSSSPAPGPSVCSPRCSASSGAWRCTSSTR